MRAREIIEEDYTQSLDTDLGSLLVGAKGSGSNSIPTQQVVVQLQRMGYAISVDSLTVMLQDNPMVMSITPDIITLSTPEGGETIDANPEDNASKVSDMAQDATDLG